MGKRCEPRKEVQSPVRIFGTDSKGAIFSASLFTVNVSRNGVELADVQAKLALDEIVGITYGANRVHFRVKWIGKPDTPQAGHVGLLNISPNKPLWDFPLPVPQPDPHQPAAVERRLHPRFLCHNPVEIHVPDGANFWGTVADLSLGGCYVEMPIPLEPGARLRIAIWIDRTKAWAEGEVAHRTPGFGIGIKFNHISQQTLTQIRLFLQSLSPFAKKKGIGTPSTP